MLSVNAHTVRVIACPMACLEPFKYITIVQKILATLLFKQVNIGIIVLSKIMC